MNVDHKELDAVLRYEIAWHRHSKELPGVYTKKERRAFIRGLRQARLLLKSFVRHLRTCKESR